MFDLLSHSSSGARSLPPIRCASGSKFRHPLAGTREGVPGPNPIAVKLSTRFQMIAEVEPKKRGTSSTTQLCVDADAHAHTRPALHAQRQRQSRVPVASRFGLNPVALATTIRFATIRYPW